MDEQAKESKGLGHFNSDTNRSSGRVKSSKATIVDAIENGKLTEARLLDTLQGLLRDAEIDETEALRLLRWAAHPKRFYVSEQNLLRALEWIKELNGKRKAEKNPAAPVFTKSNPVRNVQLLAERNAILDGKAPTKSTAVSSKPNSAATEEPTKPIAKDDRPESLKQWTGFGTIWQWPEIPEPVVETVQPPNKYERVILPPVVEGYQSQLPGEGTILKPAPPGSIMAAFIRNRKFEFVETGHQGNSVLGNVTVSSPGLGGKIFPNIRQAHFKTWQENKFSDQTVPSDMREDWKLYLQSMNSVLLPTAQHMAPAIEPFLDDGRPNPRPVRFTGKQAKVWGTKRDDARKSGPRHVYGESLGTDLAQMYVNMDKVKGFDL